MNNAICLNTNTYHGFTLADAVQGARAAGIRVLEIAAVRGYTEHARSEMTDAEVDDLLALLADNDIAAVGMSAHTNIMTADGRARFVENLDLARRLGVSYVVTGTGETHGDEDVIEDESELVGIVRELAAAADERGLRLAVETHGNNYATGEQVQRLVEAVGAPNFGINYDTGNVIFYGDVEPYEDLEMCADQIIGVHLKDKGGLPREWNFPAIGEGDIDMARVLGILAASSSTAPLSIEIEFTEAGPSGLEEVHSALARSVETIRELAPPTD